MALKPVPTPHLGAAAPGSSVRRAAGWFGILAYLAVVALGTTVWIARAVPAEDYGLFIGTILTAIVGNTCCALLGCYLVLRRISLLGDAISHAVLPGIALAFFLTGRINGWPIIAGAMVLGLATTALTQALHSFGKVAEDASMGVVFTTLFAAGVIMIAAWAPRTHLDVGCVLFGEIDIVGLDAIPWRGLLVPRALITLSGMLVVTVVFVGLLWKELKIVSFDPALAAAMGVKVGVVHYALMAMVAGVVVASFESVGSVLVVAMLIVPAAAAHLMSDRLAQMMGWSVAFAAAAGIVGYPLAAALNTNTAGMMAVLVGVQLFGAVLLAPRRGLVSRWARNFSLSLRIAIEDVVGRLFREEELRQNQRGELPPVPTSIHGLMGHLAIWSAARRGLAERHEGRWRLTDAGRASATGLLRGHRLWESYLSQHFELPTDHLHEPAERMEHFLDPTLQAELQEELASPKVDPHGKAIPPDPQQTA